MKQRDQGPDFLTIDGGEGGTGAAPLTFADHVALPYKLGFSRVYQLFTEMGLFPDRTIVAMAMGADCVNVAREAMLSIGCIQAQKCHTGHCPSGVATHSGWFQRGLVPEVNARRFEAYLDAYRGEIMSVTHACGDSHPGEFTPHCIEISSGPNRFSTLHEIFGYEKSRHRPTAE
jgi:glutamate synthase domain-containing protein 2